VPRDRAHRPRAASAGGHRERLPDTADARAKHRPARRALGRNNPVQSIDITPSTGITVSDMKSRDLNQGSVWWEFTVTVAKDAAPGPRTLVAVQQTGRTAPVTVLVPDHVPNISNLRVVSAQANQPMIDLQLTATNQGGTFGGTPKVWFLLGCGPGQPEAGIVRGRSITGQSARAFRTRAPSRSTPARGHRQSLRSPGSRQ
jgi:hypothetical protein